MTGRTADRIRAHRSSDIAIIRRIRGPVNVGVVRGIMADETGVIAPRAPNRLMLGDHVGKGNQGRTAGSGEVMT